MKKTMNRRNNWKETLNSVNDSLNHYGIALEVTRDDENTYSINIVGPDATSECACGCFEEELSDVITEAKGWAMEDLSKYNQLNYVLHKARALVINALAKYVEKHGEQFTLYHTNELGIEQHDGETISRVINFFDNGGCVYARYAGNGECEATVITALYISQNERGYKSLYYCGFYNEGVEYDEDASEFIIDPISSLAIEELYLIANKIQTIK